MLARAGRRLDRSQPFVDARLPDGSRLHVVIPPITDHWAVNIRKFVGLRADSLDELVALGSCSAPAAAFLDAAVRAGLSIVVAGAVGAGKTTLLNCLAAVDPGARADRDVRRGVRAPDRRARTSSRCSAGSRTSRAKARSRCATSCARACACDPDRIVVGEVRGAESLDMLLALNSGAAGMTSVHANSAREALRKLTTLPLLAGENLDRRFVAATVAACVDLVVFCRRARRPAGDHRDPRGRRAGRRRRRADAGTVFDGAGARRCAGPASSPAALERFAERGIDLDGGAPVSVVLALAARARRVPRVRRVHRAAASRAAGPDCARDRIAATGWLAGGLGNVSPAQFARGVRRLRARRWRDRRSSSSARRPSRWSASCAGRVRAGRVLPARGVARCAGPDSSAGPRRSSCWPARCGPATRLPAAVGVVGRPRPGGAAAGVPAPWSPTTGSPVTSSARSSGSGVALADPTADRVVATLVLAHRVGGRELGRVLRTLGGVPARGPRGPQGDRGAPVVDPRRGAGRGGRAVAGARCSSRAARRVRARSTRWPGSSCSSVGAAATVVGYRADGAHRPAARGAAGARRRTPTA